jgi:hypothetical protein
VKLALISSFGDDTFIKGFAAFFTIFEITRRLALKTKEVAQMVTFGQDKGDYFRGHFPRTVHGVTLVTGGVIIDITGTHFFYCANYEY